MLNEIGQMTWRHRSVIDLDCWTREELYFFLDQSRHMENVMDRPVKKVPALRGKMCVNLFFENSTRTRVSFELAEKMLSADVVNWSVSGSSAAKGEGCVESGKYMRSLHMDLLNAWREVPAAPRRLPHFHFNMLPEVQGFGTAREILVQFLNHLRAHGETHVFGQVVTFEDRRGAKVFERFGFQVVEKKEITKYRAHRDEPVYLCTVLKDLNDGKLAEYASR